MCKSTPHNTLRILAQVWHSSAPIYYIEFVESRWMLGRSRIYRELFADTSPSEQNEYFTQIDVYHKRLNGSKRQSRNVFHCLIVSSTMLSSWKENKNRNGNIIHEILQCGCSHIYGECKMQKKCRERRTSFSSYNYEFQH